jgi:DNA-binding FadR family transcriptional regulator
MGHNIITYRPNPAIPVFSFGGLEPFPLSMTRKLKNGPIPLYCRLERALRQRILMGKITSAGHFPTERQLCEDFQVSRITVRQALMIVENEGLIGWEQGRGTFGAPPHPIRSAVFDPELRPKGAHDEALFPGSES